MWLKSKSSLNRERKKLVLTTVHGAACFLHSTDCGGLWYCWLALLPCESLLKDSKRKGNRKCESEETAEWWRSSYHRRKGLASFPWSRGCLETRAPQGVSVCVFVLRPIDLCLCVWAFLFSCLVLVDLPAVWPGHSGSVSWLYATAVLPESLPFLHFVVKATEFLEFPVVSFWSSSLECSVICFLVTLAMIALIWEINA